MFINKNINPPPIMLSTPFPSYTSTSLFTSSLTCQDPLIHALHINNVTAYARSSTFILTLKALTQDLLLTRTQLFFSDYYEDYSMMAYPSENPQHPQHQQQVNRHRNTGRQSESSSSEFQCLKCGKRYSLRNNLQRHVKFECDGQRRFWCYLCPNKYTQNASLHRHLLHHHNVDVRETTQKYRRKPI